MNLYSLTLKVISVVTHQLSVPTAEARSLKLSYELLTHYHIEEGISLQEELKVINEIVHQHIN